MGVRDVAAIRIREFVETYWPQVWHIVQGIVRAQETFTYDPSTTAEEAHAIWIEAPPGLTVVAVDDSRVLVPPRWAPTAPDPDRMYRPRVSWSPRTRGAEGWARCYAGLRWLGRETAAMRECSSMRWSKRTVPLWSSTSGSDSAWSEPFPAPSRIRRWVMSACMSCTARFERSCRRPA